MSREALSARLTELESGLEGLLACLESGRLQLPRRRDAPLDAAWRNVQHGFERVHAALEGAGVAREEAAPLRERAEHCLRLYAVATGLLAREREALAAERAACSGARQRLRRLRGEGQSGGSCDVRA
jgi:hypothetical protein